VTMAC